MTAQVAILNRHGVALASDSAVTIGSGKVLHGASKVFSLGPTHQIAIMCAGNSTFLGVPWDTMVVRFREHLKKRPLSETWDYVNAFSAFLSEGFPILPAAEDLFIRGAAGELLNDIQTKWLGTDSSSELAGEPGSGRRLKDAIARQRNDLRTETKELPGISAQNIEMSCRDLFAEIVSGHLGEIAHMRDCERGIHALLSEWFAKPVESEMSSNLVICGFGRQDNFPALAQLTVDGAVSRQPRCWADDWHTFSDHGTWVFPIAQSEPMETFISGRSERWAVNAYFECMTAIRSAGVETGLDDDNRLYEIAQRHAMNAYERLNAASEAEWTKPLLNTVSSLPAPELAKLAEAMIYLTAVRQRLTPQLETVGGDIVAAILTKSSGFQWTRRPRT